MFKFKLFNVAVICFLISACKKDSKTAPDTDPKPAAPASLGFNFNSL
jgi:hypothetical protein